MKTHLYLPALILAVTAGPAGAFPPAPFHRIFGIVRDNQGVPLGSGDATVILSGTGNKEIVRSPTDAATSATEPANYSLNVPMDAGVTDDLYQVSALRPALPFTIRVTKGGVSYVPIQMNGADWKIGDPAGSTRIDLTLGVDSDGDGLADAWEQEVIRTDGSHRLQSINDIKPGDDADGDGLSNLQEYIAGTYALDPSDGLFLKVMQVSDGVAQLQFLAVAKRTYRIKSSVDLAEFGELPFSVRSDGEEKVVQFRSTETKLLNVYVSVGDVSRTLFKLYVD